MREAVADLWSYHQDGAWIGITTNGMTRRDGSAVMGAGLAKQAALRFPTLPKLLGEALRQQGNHVMAWPEFRLVTFPTKHDWQRPSELALIERSARELLQVIRVQNLPTIVLPRPGCGLGQLEWDAVRPLLARLWDDRFVIVTPPLPTKEFKQNILDTIA